MALITGLSRLTALLCAAAGAAAQESGHRKLPLSSLSQPAYEPTKQPTSGGRCSDDSSWRYDGGDKALESAIKLGGDYYGWIAYNDKDTEGDFAWEDGCTSSYTNWDAGPPQEPNNDPNFGGEDCTIKWSGGTVWNDVPCDFTYPCYCQDVKGGGY